MSVIKLVVAYDGTDLHGWAGQPRHRTVEGELTRVLERALGQPVRLSAAGRTDAGVHARGQVVSFVSYAQPLRVQRVVNKTLGPRIVVVSASVAPAGFDARHSATSREYRYRMDVGDAPDPFTARFVWHRPGDFKLGAMRAAARALVGSHDFASFGRATTPGGPTVRRLQRLSVSRTGDRIEVSIRANAFLRQMVRSLVGTLVECGAGRIDPGGIPGILAAKDRSGAGRPVPPHGLTLERVQYRSDGARRGRSGR